MSAVTLAAPPVEVVTDRERADLLLQHPLRTRILEVAREPASATEIARTLGVGSQRLNYHVRKLAAAGFLELEQEVERGNLVERRYRASALSYAVAPEALGPVGQGSFPEADRVSAMYLLGRAERLRDEVVRAFGREAATEVETLTLEAEVHLPSPTLRAEFARALREAFEGVVQRYPIPDEPDPAGSDDGPQAEQAGRPERMDRYRIMVGAWPAAGDAPVATSPDEQDEQRISDRADAAPRSEV